MSSEGRLFLFLLYVYNAFILTSCDAAKTGSPAAMPNLTVSLTYNLFLSIGWAGILNFAQLFH